MNDCYDDLEDARTEIQRLERQLREAKREAGVLEKLSEEKTKVLLKISELRKDKEPTYVNVQQAIEFLDQQASDLAAANERVEYYKELSEKNLEMHTNNLKVITQLRQERDDEKIKVASIEYDKANHLKALEIIDTLRAEVERLKQGDPIANQILQTACDDGDRVIDELCARVQELEKALKEISDDLSPDTQFYGYLHAVAKRALNGRKI